MKMAIKILCVQRSYPLKFRRTIPDNGTVLPDHAGIISLPPIGIFDQLNGGKIRAGKDARLDDDFVIVARVEALIAGWGLEEALRRAKAYHRAGADAILIHSARADAGEVLAFKEEWGDRAPVVIVPTKYYATPTRVFREAGFSVVIWANHLLRSSLAAMQETARELFARQSLVEIEGRVASLNEVFRLQNEPELERAERLYLPASATPATACGADFMPDDSSRREIDDDPQAPQTRSAYELSVGGGR